VNGMPVEKDALCHLTAGGMAKLNADVCRRSSLEQNHVKFPPNVERSSFLQILILYGLFFFAPRLFFFSTYIYVNVLIY